MNSKSIVSALAGVLTLSSSAFAVIYGTDGRQDAYTLNTTLEQGLVDSSVALIESGKLTSQKDGFVIDGAHYGNDNNLCKDERFFDQPSAAFCSGFMIGPDLIATAGHCLDSAEKCKDTRVVFGYAIREAGKYPSTTPASEVYSCKKILVSQYTVDNADFTIFQVDRKIKDHSALALNRSTSKIPVGTELGVVGNPKGLPTKLAGGANVRTSTAKSFFVATLDTYAASAGSAVFNPQTGLVEGIAIRGEADYTYDETAGCRVSKRCAPDKCRGEDVMRISEVAKHLP